MKHTPGPWSTDPEGLVAIGIEDANGSLVCYVEGGTDDPIANANANLIAAAPELLATLRAVADWASDAGPFAGMGPMDIAAIARAAIATAEGRGR